MQLHSYEPWQRRSNGGIREPRESRADWSRRWILPEGERCCSLNSFSFRVFNVFSGLNIRLENETFKHSEVDPLRREPC